MFAGARRQWLAYTKVLAKYDCLVDRLLPYFLVASLLKMSKAWASVHTPLRLFTEKNRTEQFLNDQFLTTRTSWSFNQSRSQSNQSHSQSHSL